MESESAKSEFGQTESWLASHEESEWRIIDSGKHTIEISLFYGCGVGLNMNLK